MKKKGTCSHFKYHQCRVRPWYMAGTTACGPWYALGSLLIGDPEYNFSHESTTIAGGVRVSYGCTFIINNGKMDGNTSGSCGGAVWDNGDFQFLTGEISNNKAAVGGGGIYVVSKGLTMRVGTDSDVPALIDRKSVV